jgi:hypothetical protein
MPVFDERLAACGLVEDIVNVRRAQSPCTPPVVILTRRHPLLSYPESKFVNLILTGMLTGPF